ncbi:hypothetical protein CFC21_103435 [Triticum aestivum]|uniref:Legume lectin domain-containing protein n=3 Tax=Triticum TaxID=4564 RepID=A0A9R1A2Y2_TRITD|nr:uncharacterized protein LOC119346976 [Triticum dicoccoides]XP_044433114.1 uncharacterized protein LOC123159354 [Triticum aestivum]KAF7102279.1 hypothetical protein CFC21_103435 [Triticum aestivum]VAI88808.1 unnamed protein product [Triticum turgidum subsp. durum]
MSALALALVLLCSATIMVAPAAADVESHSFPVFNVTTTESLWVATNMSIVMPAALLFMPEQPLPEVNVSEGFLLLPKRIDVWRAGAGALPTREASFNTSFTVESSAPPVSFVLLLDRFPTLNNPLGLRGANDSWTGAAPNATDGLTAVEVGTVRSYAPESPNVGLNVTITPNGTAAPGRRAVWVEYNAVKHLLRVYVAAGGEPRPARALLDARLSLAGQGTTQTALVGFFAARVRDIFLGVRDWDLMVDRLNTNGKKKGTSWWVILIAVLGSVAATAAIISLVVCSFVSRRRARDMEPKQ